MIPKKRVLIDAHSFDCMPAHFTATGVGSGANVRVAAQRAIADLFTQHGLRRKQIHSFKLSVVVMKGTVQP